MISNTDSMLLVYSTEHIRVKAYVSGVTRQARRSTRFRAILQKYGVLVGGVWVIGGNHYRLEPRFHRAGLLGRVRWGSQISSGFLPWRYPISVDLAGASGIYVRNIPHDSWGRNECKAI